jgi:hypothetical protein
MDEGSTVGVSTYFYKIRASACNSEDQFISHVQSALSCSFLKTGQGNKSFNDSLQHQRMILASFIFVL